VIGTSHQQQQLPCQDYGGDRILHDVIMGAVADGAGSAQHADVGAQLAVKTALRTLASTEEWLLQQHCSWESLSKPLTQQQATKLFTTTVNKVVAAFQHQAGSHGYAVKELSCTLLSFIATPHWMAAMQIGDGFMVVRSEGPHYRLLFKPDKGEFANQTTFVTSADALQAMQVRVLSLSGQQNFICAATDALENVAIHLKDWMPGQGFFRPLEQYLQETPDPVQDDHYLVDFLKSEQLNRKTDDDKTLLLCLYSAQVHT
jgi:hypothetical protein